MKDGTIANYIVGKPIEDVIWIFAGALDRIIQTNCEQSIETNSKLTRMAKNNVDTAQNTVTSVHDILEILLLHKKEIKTLQEEVADLKEENKKLQKQIITTSKLTTKGA